MRVREISKSIASRLLREHPTLVLTLGYIGLTLVGLVYDLWFYAYFKINILNFSETSDFLLAAIRNPLVILLSIAPIFLLIALQVVREKARAKSARYDAFNRKYENTRWNSPNIRLVIYGLFIAIYAILFTQLYAVRVADGIKAGNGRRVVFARANGANSAEKPILLGSTTKFFFLYYPSRKETEVVPVDNTASITVDSRRRRERERDSLAALRQKR